MLFSLDDFKTRFRVTTTATDDQLHALRQSVSAAIERVCNRVIEDDGNEITEYHDGNGLPYILLKRPPIHSVTGVWIDPGRTFDSSTQLASTDYFIVDEGNAMGIGTLELSPSWWAPLAARQMDEPSFGYGRQSVKVVYRGGFREIPSDLREAAMLWAFHAQAHKPGVTSETIGSYSASYEQSSRGSVPREVMQLLSPFIRKSVGRRM